MTTSLEPFFVDDFVLVFLDFLEPLPLLLPDVTGAEVGEVDGSSLHGSRWAGAQTHHRPYANPLAPPWGLLLVGEEAFKCRLKVFSTDLRR